METSLSPPRLAEYVARQVEALFPDGPVDRTLLGRAVDGALARLEHCFSRIARKYYRRGELTVYDHLNTDQHAAFLYLVSHGLWAEHDDSALASKVYGLNKALHGIDVFYEVELPAVFLFQHPVGSVLGRARYGDYLVVYQGVTVGSDLDGNYPELGEGVVLFGGSRVIGRARIGPNSWLAPGCTVMDAALPPDSVLFGIPPATQRRPSRRQVVRDVFGQ